MDDREFIERERENKAAAEAAEPALSREPDHSPSDQVSRLARHVKRGTTRDHVTVRGSSFYTERPNSEKEEAELERNVASTLGLDRDSARAWIRHLRS